MASPVTPTAPPLAYLNIEWHLVCESIFTRCWEGDSVGSSVHPYSKSTTQPDGALVPEEGWGQGGQRRGGRIAEGRRGGAGGGSDTKPRNCHCNCKSSVYRTCSSMDVADTFHLSGRVRCDLSAPCGDGPGPGGGGGGGGVGAASHRSPGTLGNHGTAHLRSLPHLGTGVMGHNGMSVSATVTGTEGCIGKRCTRREGERARQLQGTHVSVVSAPLVFSTPWSMWVSLNATSAASISCTSFGNLADKSCSSSGSFSMSKSRIAPQSYLGDASPHANQATDQATIQ